MADDIVASLASIRQRKPIAPRKGVNPVDAAAIGHENAKAGLRDALALAAPHADGLLPASDGARIAFRTTTPAKPRAVLVLQMGTLGKPEYFDQLADRLARDGIKSYAVQPRTYASKHWQHALDLDQVVKLAAREHPGVPLTVGGVSLGSAIALNWNARHNAGGLKVLALAPVVLPKFLGPVDMAKATLGIASERIGKRLVHTPMSKRIPLTTNPASPEFALQHPEKLKVPAKLFGDVMMMNAESAAAGRVIPGPLLIGIAGEDRVAANWASKGFAKLLRASDKAVEVFPGLAHDLTQEWHDPRFVRRIARFILPK